MTQETDADVLAADQANFEYPPRIVPYTGYPDTTDPDDPEEAR